MPTITQLAKNARITEKKKRNVPNDKPKNFEVGYIKVSENDKNRYKIVQNKNGVHRWKRL